MALAVASTSTKAEAIWDSSVTITKPSGVTAGDLLVMVVGQAMETPDAVCTGFTSRLEFGHDYGNLSNDCGLVVFTRIADSSDVSASDYTVTGNNIAAITMLRITGYTSGNPIYVSNTVEAGSGSSTNLLNPTGLSLSVLSSQLLLLAWGQVGENGTGNGSNYSVTPNNTTWTEIAELDSGNSAGTRDGSWGVAYGSRASTNTITEWTTTVTTSSSADTQTVIGALLVICEPVSASADATFLAVTPSMFNAVATTQDTATTETLVITPTISSSTASSSSSGVTWTTINKT